MSSDHDGQTLRRLPFGEAMEPAPASPRPGDEATGVRRLVSRHRPWMHGPDLPTKYDGQGPYKHWRKSFARGAFGGHIFAQAGLAAARIVEGESEEISPSVGGKLCIHGVFTNPGSTDRPFIFEVSNITSSRTFSTRLVNVRQPVQPSAEPAGPYPVSDAELPLGEVCFSGLVTFKRPFAGPDDVQEFASPQAQHAELLGSRAPDEWTPSPATDIAFIRDMFPTVDHGTFPVLDMYKVDMAGFNAGKPVTERRHLILYRLHRQLPTSDVNAHVICHAFGADRNGLLMVGEHLGYGYRLGPVASLSYAFYVHVNAEETIMEGGGWWIQEVRFPRASAGRALLEIRIWSPKGRHVATGYQDGVILPARGDEKGKI